MAPRREASGGGRGHRPGARPGLRAERGGPTRDGAFACGGQAPICGPQELGAGSGGPGACRGPRPGEPHCALTLRPRLHSERTGRGSSHHPPDESHRGSGKLGDAPHSHAAQLGFRPARADAHGRPLAVPADTASPLRGRHPGASPEGGVTEPRGGASRRRRSSARARGRAAPRRGPGARPRTPGRGGHPGTAILRPPRRRRGGQRAGCTRARCPFWALQTFAETLLEASTPGEGCSGLGWSLPGHLAGPAPSGVDTAPRLGSPHARGPRTSSPKPTRLREPGAPGLSAQELATW